MLWVLVELKVLDMFSPSSTNEENRLDVKLDLYLLIYKKPQTAHKRTTPILEITTVSMGKL